METSNTREIQANVRLCQQGLGTNDVVDFDTTWAILASSLREIHTKNASQLSFEALYRNAYKLVLKKLGEQLYFRVKDFEEAWLTAEVLPRVLAELSAVLLVDNAGTSSLTNANERRAAGEKMLTALKKAWEDHNLCMNMTSDILMYMVGSIRFDLAFVVTAADTWNRSVFTARITGNLLYLPLLWPNSGIMFSEHLSLQHQIKKS